MLNKHLHCAIIIVKYYVALEICVRINIIQFLIKWLVA